MTFTDHTDEDVLALYADDGSSASTRQAAFRELVDRYERRVYGICYRFFGNHEDAQDAAQDTFISLARRAGSFRGDSKLSTFVYRVATNACHDLARKRARRPQTPVEDVGTVAGPIASLESVEEVAAGHDLAEHIQQALLELDETSRTLIVLCSIEGRDYKEVAAALELPVGTVKSRVFRARAKLAEILAPLLGADGEDAPSGAREATPPGPGSSRRSGGPRAPPG